MPELNTERLFPVIIASGLLDAFEPYVRIVVELARSPRSRAGGPAPEDTLETLLSSWGNLGAFVAMPSKGLLRASGGTRAELFSSGFRLNVLFLKSNQRVEWLVHYDGISEAWLDVLLNCLEGFHVQIAPVLRVELTSAIEPASMPWSTPHRRESRAIAAATAMVAVRARLTWAYLGLNEDGRTSPSTRINPK